MAATFVAATQKSGSFATGVTHTLPAGAAVGQLALVSVAIDGNTWSASPAPGWTQIAGPGFVSSIRMFLFGKILTSADLAANHVFPFDGSAFRYTSGVELWNNAALAGIEVAWAGSSSSSLSFFGPTQTITKPGRIAGFWAFRGAFSFAPTASFSGVQRTQAFTTSVSGSSPSHAQYGIIHDSAYAAGATVDPINGSSTTGGGYSFVAAQILIPDGAPPSTPATITGATAKVTAAGRAGVARGGRDARITGVAAKVSAKASSGAVQAGVSATISGVTASVGLTAAGGQVRLGVSVTIGGVTASVGLTGRAGSASGGAVLAGVAATVVLGSTVGQASSGATLEGETARVTLVGQAGRPPGVYRDLTIEWGGLTARELTGGAAYTRTIVATAHARTLEA